MTSHIIGILDIALLWLIVAMGLGAILAFLIVRVRAWLKRRQDS